MIRICVSCGAERCVCPAPTPALATTEAAAVIQSTDPDARITAVLALRAMAVVEGREPAVALTALINATKLLGRELGVSEDDIAGLLRECNPHLRSKGLAS